MKRWYCSHDGCGRTFDDLMEGLDHHDADHGGNWRNEE